jgi:GNAT superfamily N-acetyltransferase
MSFDVRPWQPGDEAAILALFRDSYGKDLSEATWTWRFATAAAGPGVIVLAWDGPRLAAHYAVTAVQLSVDGADVACGLSGTTMTHPDYRGVGLFPRLAEATYAAMHARGMQLVWGFPNDLSHRGFVEDLGWKDIYEIPTLRATLPLRRAVDGDAAVREETHLDGDFDALWQVARRRYRMVGRRDARALRWRYIDNPGDRYRLLALRDASGLGGYAVIKRYQQELHVIDLLARDDASEARLARTAIAVAQSEGAASVSLWLAPHRPLHGELERLGFRNDKPVTYFGARAFDPTVDRTIVEDYRSWHVMMGDSDVY